MSEPQHPQPHDMDTHKGRPLSAGPAAVPSGFDSLAAVGAQLAQLRQSKGWSVEDVSSRLKVAPVKLRGLEAGDLSQFPDTTFALGVVRSYAKMLGADPTPMTQALRREKGAPEPALTMPASAGTDLPRGKVSLSLGGGGGPRHRSWIWGVALVVVVVIALAMWHTNNGESNAWLARLKGMAGTSAMTGGGSSVVGQAASGATVTGEVVQPAASAVVADNSGGALQGASATPLPQPLPMAGAASAVSMPLAAGPKGASAAAAVALTASGAGSSAATGTAAASAAAALPEGSSTVSLTVKQDSWFSVRQKDGKEMFSGLVRAGETKQISGQVPLKVTVGNKAGLESITLDGQPVDPAKYGSAKGNVARFALP